MVEPVRPVGSEGDSATYELRVQGSIPRVLRERYPAIRVGRRPAETVLHRGITDLTELDVLLEQLQTMGVTLTELREVAAVTARGRSSCPGDDEERRSTTTAEPARRADEQPGDRGPVRSYEVHIDGLLGSALLRSMRWSHRTQPAQSVLRLRVTADGLADLLRFCADCGLTVDDVTLLSAAPSSRDRERSGGVSG